MSYIQRAWLYVSRQKIKTLILFLVLTIIAAFILTALAIQSSTDDAATDVRTSVGGIVNLSIDMSDENMETSQSAWGTDRLYAGDYITKETLEALRSVPGVVDYNATTSAGLYG